MTPPLSHFNQYRKKPTFSPFRLVLSVECCNVIFRLPRDAWTTMRGAVGPSTLETHEGMTSRLVRYLESTLHKPEAISDPCCCLWLVQTLKHHTMRLIALLVALSAAALVAADDDAQTDEYSTTEREPDISDQVHFLIYERGSYNFKELNISKSAAEQGLRLSHFDPRKKTKVLIHGWLDGGTNYFCEQMKDAYMKNFDYNVISVDWSDLSINFYSLARFAVNIVSPYVSKLFDYLQREMRVKPGDIHAIGHSLGAHIAGMAGEMMAAQKIGRITGLDPAAPLFFFGKSLRLDSSDAEFVDVIHTSVVGFRKAIGHADFYPNGDHFTQPGCGLDVVFCEHARAYEYYIESMKSPKGFWAARCHSWNDFKNNNCDKKLVLMGEPLSHNARGTYYVSTSSSSPYALGRPF